MKWFSRRPVTQPVKAEPLQASNGITRYVLSDVGLEALVQGKLTCTKVSEDGRSGEFLVEYDSIVIDVSQHRMMFCWKNTPFMELEFPVLTHTDTLTINGLQGKMPLEISG